MEAIAENHNYSQYKDEHIIGICRIVNLETYAYNKNEAAVGNIYKILGKMGRAEVKGGEKVI